MRWALLSAWSRFREVRHQQRLGFEGPLSVYAAFHAEMQDWIVVFGKKEFKGFVEPKDAVVTFVIVPATEDYKIEVRGQGEGG